MPDCLKVAVAGLGRMGQIHAQNLYDISRETGGCAIVALVDENIERARRFAADNDFRPAIFASIDELADSGRLPSLPLRPIGTANMHSL